MLLLCTCRVGPTSPIGWIRENILQIIPDHSEKRKKILLGLNFYGYDFGGANGIQGKPFRHTFIEGGII